MPLPSWVEVGVQVFRSWDRTPLEERNNEVFYVLEFDGVEVLIQRYENGGGRSTLATLIDTFEEEWLNEREARRAFLSSLSLSGVSYTLSEPEYVGDIPPPVEIGVIPQSPRENTAQTLREGLGRYIGESISSDLRGAISQELADRLSMFYTPLETPSSSDLVFDPATRSVGRRPSPEERRMGYRSLPVGRFPEEVTISGLTPDFANVGDHFHISLEGERYVEYQIVSSTSDDIDSSIARGRLVREDQGPNIPPWVEVGAIVRPNVVEGGDYPVENFQITSIEEGEVGLSRVDLASLSLDSAIDDSHQVAYSDIQRMAGDYHPIQRAIPPWFRVGAQITNPSFRDYSTIVGINRVLSNFTVRPSTRYTLGTSYTIPLTQIGDWAPYLENNNAMPSLTEYIPPKAGTPIVGKKQVDLPSWVEVGTLVRTTKKPRRVLRVTKIDQNLRQISFERVIHTTPEVKVSSQEREILDFKLFHSFFEELLADGTPKAELTCPHCKSTGVRDLDRETPNSTVHAYICKERHRWNYSAKGPNQGELVPLSRFERMSDI